MSCALARMSCNSSSFTIRLIVSILSVGEITRPAEGWPVIRIALPDAEVRQLEEARRTAADPAPRHRAQIVLMAHRGRRPPALAADTGTAQRSVQRWLNAYRDRGLGGLRPRKAQGAKPTLTAGLAPVLRRGVIDGPAKHGLDRADGTCAERAGHLRKAKGVWVGTSALQAFGARHGIRPYRPTYRFLRGGPAKPPTARDELAALKKGRKPARSSC